MGFFRRKKNRNIELVNSQPIGSVSEVWIVSWDRRHGPDRENTTRATKVFLSEDDARNFMNNLYMAQDLLQNTHKIHINLERQR
jgi:hypothetical protein